MKKIFLILMGLVAANAFAVTPADPTNLTWYDCGDESGDSYLTFTLPTVDVNGNPLDIEMMGYRIYTDDDQIFTFNSAQYENVWGSATDIYYYNWETGSDLQSNGVYFYRTNADGFERFFNTRIGVQVFYLNDNFGIGGVSNIVYTYLDNPIADVPRPKNPTPDYWEEWGTFMEEFMFAPAKDRAGKLVADDYTIDKFYNGEPYTILDNDKVTYSIYTDDDQLFVFDPSEYSEFTEPQTEIPYGFNSMNIEPTTVHFNDRPATTVETGRFFNWRIGIQFHYTVDGVKNSSDIIYLEVFPKLNEATDVTSTSFVADWTSPENNVQQAGFQGYDLYVINKATNDTTAITDIPALTYYDNELGRDMPLPGRTYLVEGLTPGATYEYYVVARHTFSVTKAIASDPKEITLPGEQTHLRGDVNHDHDVTIADVSALIDYLLDSENSDACTICADTNLDTEVTIADVSALIDYLLNGAW